MTAPATHVPRIENGDDAAQRAFALHWVNGFRQLEEAARAGHCDRFLRLATFLLGELERWPRVFALNRERFDVALARLDAACRERARTVFIT